MGHSCGTLLWDALVGNSCGTLLRDTLVRRSCGTRLRDTLAGHSWDTHTGHSCGTLYLEHSCRTLLWVSSCGALFWDNLDATNHPAHQRHAGFTPACFALLSGTAPRKRTFHQGRANRNGTATSRTSRRHTVCPDTRSTTNHPARQRHAAFTLACFALPSGTAPRKHTSHPGRANPNGTATSRTSRRRTVCPHT